MTTETETKPAVSQSGDQLKLPNIVTQSIYAGKYRDRNPDISAAGKLTATGDSAYQCLTPPARPLSPESVRRFRATLRPDAGKPSVFYGKAYDPHLRWAADMTHGLVAQPSIAAGKLLNPQPLTLFKYKLNQKKEQLYASHRRGPLGKSHDQKPGFPEGLDVDNVTFGILTERDIGAGILINPNKSPLQVEEESEVGRDLYRKSHRDYLVGESKDRKYAPPNYGKMKLYGVPTPHDNTGGLTKKSLKWLHELQSEKAAKIVSKRVDDFRERTEPQLGQVHDPIKDTLRVPSDHTFGILVKPDTYGAGDLMHGRVPGEYLRGKDRQRGVLAAIRQHLKKANYHSFENLLHAFKFYDKDGTGKIDINNLHEVCAQFNLPVEPELLVQLMDCCDANKDGFIDYVEFANFLNWKDKLPSGFPDKKDETAHTSNAVVEDKDLVPKSPQSRASTPRRLQKQIDDAITQQKTSSSVISAVVGGLSTKDYRSYGVPTIRSDIPVPRIRRIDDTKNYGDESDAYGLLNPSIYSVQGVHEKDFLLPRPKEEIKEIFTNIGVKMTLDTFDDLWKMASQRHPKGHVSVESFRGVLDEIQAAQLQS
ncbi:EF-hand domain-containing family member B-like [Lingula anatina]|uniref:EF-hand domain-containing family member B-like n=1 Tax=Lingula anatina TaxID=7574 RepID=A0A1S3J6Y1_LINAN|nr:EF-hand domain-containing family member B-like [Lingula anatina]|eukprot:XP_013406172.1 EF-hand domain-containing family member B-like [Lingula anatina]